MRLVADIESDHFLEKMTKIHCIAAVDANNPSRTFVFGPEEIDAGVALLQSADELIFHNGITFDVPAIKKLYPNFSTDDLILTDTLVLSRLLRADLLERDIRNSWSDPESRFPKRLFGSHGLAAWGHRLGVYKGDFGKTTDWKEWSQEMQDYCVQDVIVTHKLWKHLAPEKGSQRAIRFEHKIAELCDRIGNAGWTFDIQKSGELYAQLALEKASIEEELGDLFPAWTVEEEFVPKRDNQRLGYVAGEVFIKQKEIKFNPNSRKHIEYCLRRKYNWKPTVFTESGDAKIDETILSSLPFPEAQKLARSFMLQKRLGMLAEGNNAWMRLVSTDGKLRHVINPIGSITHRCSSFKPNLQQVPAVRAPFGKECRELFTVPNGNVLVGADLSGIELRCLAHYLQDGGAFAKEVTSGDIHTANMKSAGLQNRDQAKTMIYALCYGAGNQRLGQIIGKGAAEGRMLRDRFYKANPAFADLLRQVRKVASQRGHLIGLDGRHLPIRSEHGALNVLLQSCGALIAKMWVHLIDQEIKRQGLPATIIAFVHDEIQVSVKQQQQEGVADHVGTLTMRMAEEAGRAFDFKVPIAAEYSVGRTWADTH